MLFVSKEKRSLLSPLFGRVHVGWRVIKVLIYSTGQHRGVDKQRLEVPEINQQNVWNVEKLGLTYCNEGTWPFKVKSTVVHPHLLILRGHSRCFIECSSLQGYILRTVYWHMGYDILMTNHHIGKTLEWLLGHQNKIGLFVSQRPLAILKCFPNMVLGCPGFAWGGLLSSQW